MYTERIHIYIHIQLVIKHLFVMVQLKKSSGNGATLDNSIRNSTGWQYTTPPP